MIHAVIISFVSGSKEYPPNFLTPLLRLFNLRGSHLFLDDTTAGAEIAHIQRMIVEHAILDGPPFIQQQFNAASFRS